MMFKTKAINLLYIAVLLLVSSPVWAQTDPSSQTEKNRIYRQEILPLVGPQSAVDWEGLEKKFGEKYGAVGRELVCKSKPYFYLRASDWKNMYETHSRFISKYGTDSMSPASLNNYAWAIFTNFADKKLLEDAAEWSVRSVERQKDDPEPMDTHANILYRLGKTREAIEWQEKAVSLARSESDKNRFQAVIDKMKKGEPTWP